MKAERRAGGSWGALSMVDATALPGGVHQLGDGGLDALVGVGDDSFVSRKAAPAQLAQKLD
jgi:hypothetical protein